MRLAVLVAVLALVSTACVSFGTGSAATAIAGRIERLDDGTWTAVTGGAVDDQLRAVDDAALELGGQTVRLRRGTEIRLTDQGLVLNTGDVLVEGTDVRLEFDGGSATIPQVSVSGTGAYRLLGGVAPRTVVYSGGVTVDRPGESQRVNAFRQLDLTPRRLDADLPIAYSADDPFDVRMLPGAIALDEQIASLVVAIDATYGPSLQPASFYRSFVSVADADLPVLTRTSPTATGDGLIGPPADALVGLFMTRAVANAGGVDLLTAVDRVASLRDDGARWGLVAVSQGVGVTDFGGVVDTAVAARDVAEQTGAVAAPQAPPAPPAQPVTTPDSGPAPAPPPAAAPPPPPAPEPTEDPPIIPAPFPGSDIVEELLGNIIGPRGGG